MIIVLLLFVFSAFFFSFLCFVVAAVSVDQGGLSSLTVFLFCLFLLCCVQSPMEKFHFCFCCVQNQSYAKSFFVFAALCSVQNQPYGKVFVVFCCCCAVSKISPMEKDFFVFAVLCPMEKALFFVVLCLKSVLWKRLLFLLCCVQNQSYGKGFLFGKGFLCCVQNQSNGKGDFIPGLVPTVACAG